MIEDLGKIEFKLLLGADVPEEKIDFHRKALIVRETGMKSFNGQKKMTRLVLEHFKVQK